MSKPRGVATSRFVSGPDDSLATECIYEVSENKPRSRAQGSGFQETSGSRGRNFRVPNQLPNLDVPEMPNLDFMPDLMNRLENFANQMNLPFGNFLNGLMDFIRQFLNSLGINNPLESLMDGLVDWNLRGSYLQFDPSFMNQIKEIAYLHDTTEHDTNRFHDNLAEFLFFSATLNKMIDSGLGPQSHTLLDTIEHPKIQKSVALQGMKHLLDNAKKGTPRVESSFEGDPHQPEYITGPLFKAPGLDGLNTNAQTNQQLRGSPGVRNSGMRATPMQNAVIGNHPFDISTVNILAHYLSFSDVSSMYPDAAHAIARGYRLPRQQRADLIEQYGSLTKAMGNVDPWWNRHPAKEEVTRLDRLNHASQDTLQVLANTPDSEFVEQAMIAQSYPQKSVQELLKEQYPDAGI